MLDIPLHAGTEHPNLVWVLVPSYLAFVAGLGIGVYSDRVRSWLRSRTAATGE
ncbi:hypothetical protein OB905_12405 [Halobacteria archaeon AArc-dxtr1]|nr:hypothetical protein [Halobacteria archaeon AArc-dxtr1]